MVVTGSRRRFAPGVALLAAGVFDRLGGQAGGESWRSRSRMGMIRGGMGGLRPVAGWGRYPTTRVPGVPPMLKTLQVVHCSHFNTLPPLDDPISAIGAPLRAASRRPPALPAPPCRSRSVRPARRPSSRSPDRPNAPGCCRRASRCRGPTAAGNTACPYPGDAGEAADRSGVAAADHERGQHDQGRPVLLLPPAEHLRQPPDEPHQLRPRDARAFGSPNRKISGRSGSPNIDAPTIEVRKWSGIFRVAMAAWNIEIH